MLVNGTNYASFSTVPTELIGIGFAVPTTEVVG